GRVRSRLRVEPLGAAPDARVDAVWERTAPALDARIVPVRDAAYYAWRFGASPAGCQQAVAVLDGGTPIAVAALERAPDRAAIVDGLCAPGDRRRVLNALLAACRGADAVRTLVHIPSPITR